MNFEFNLLLSGKRHCPSSAIFADNKFPSLSFKITEYESLNKGLGRHIRNHINNPDEKINAVHFFLCVLNEDKKKPG
jgi:hypothetical protein